MANKQTTLAATDSNGLSWRNLDEHQLKLALIASVVPPPVSLDILCRIAGMSPVRALQISESLIRQGIFKTYESQGSGFYRLHDPEFAQELISLIPEDLLRRFGRAASDACESEYPDGAKRWLALAHIHEVTRVPVSNICDVLKAGDYCSRMDFPDEAAKYYRLVIDCLEGDCAGRDEATAYIDATIGICTCKEHPLSFADREMLLEKALIYALEMADIERQVRLLVLDGQIKMTVGNYENAATAFDNAWKMVEQLDGRQELKRWTALASTELLFWQGRVRDAVERHEAVIGNLEELPSNSDLLQACARLGWIYGINGQTARGLGLIEAARQKAVALNFGRISVYADLMTALTLMDARRIAEAEVYLERIAATPESRLDRYIVWALLGMKSYSAFVRGDYEETFEYQNRAYEHSKALGFRHHRGSFNLEYMEALEEKGLVHPEWNFDSEIKRLLDWPDIYMQGVAHRYWAQRISKRGGEREKVVEELEKSMALLNRCGAKTELAFSQILLARLLIQTDCDKEEAQNLLREAWAVLTVVNERIFPDDLKKYVKEINREEILINTLAEVSKSLGTVRSRHDLLNRIINLTIGLSGAERGAFFLVQKDGKVEMVASRNIDPFIVGDPCFAAGYQRIQEAISKGEEFVIGNVRKSFMHSAFDETRRWSICYPATLKGKTIGALYMEGGFGQMNVPEEILPLLKAIGTQVAVALDNVTAYEEIAELKDQLQAETRFYRRESCALEQLEQIVGHSEGIRKVFELIQSVAPSDSSVFIHGETGVGKQLVARAVHALSHRKNGPFITVNIASLSEGLIASELFGHEKGAFTGAAKTHLGRFELARNGTLFLDDVDALTAEVQAKLLRVLEEREFERVGGSQTIKANFRLVTASNQELGQLVEKKLFRSDLFFRLNVFPINVPPLRERKEDIPDLANYFFGIFNRKFGKEIAGISRQSMERMLAYSWPGNVRELRHVIERAVLLNQGPRLTVTLFEMPQKSMASEHFPSFREMETQCILRALEHCNWKVSGKHGAADLLRLKPTTLYSKMSRLGISMKKSIVVKK